MARGSSRPSARFQLRAEIQCGASPLVMPQYDMRSYAGLAAVSAMIRYGGSLAPAPPDDGVGSRPTESRRPSATGHVSPSPAPHDVERVLEAQPMENLVRRYRHHGTPDGAPGLSVRTLATDVWPIVTPGLSPRTNRPTVASPAGRCPRRTGRRAPRRRCRRQSGSPGTAASPPRGPGCRRSGTERARAPGAWRTPGRPSSSTSRCPSPRRSGRDPSQGRSGRVSVVDDELPHRADRRRARRIAERHAGEVAGRQAPHEVARHRALARGAAPPIASIPARAPRA